MWSTNPTNTSIGAGAYKESPTEIEHQFMGASLLFWGLKVDRDKQVVHRDLSSHLTAPAPQKRMIGQGERKERDEEEGGGGGKGGVGHTDGNTLNKAL